MTDKKHDPRRVAEQPAFILYTYPWSETSLLAEVLTRDFGRLGVVAKGAKRPQSKYRGILNPFSPLSISFSGKGDMKTLTDATWLGTLPLSEREMMSAFYLNELIVRLTARLDPNPMLFTVYLNALRSLSAGENQSVVLRYFEKDLLDVIGYGIPETDYSAPWYLYLRGDLVPTQSPDSNLGPVASGEALSSLISRTLTPGELEKEVRGITRAMIGYYLEGKPLNTRRILEELRRY